MEAIVGQNIEEKKIEKVVTPEMKAYAAEQVRIAAAQIMERMKPKRPKNVGFFHRLLTEARLPKPQFVDARKANSVIVGVRFGLRCLMTQGGYKVRKGITDLTDEQIVKRADATVSMITSVMLSIQAAETVILRHGLKDEYDELVLKLQEDLGNMMPQPTEEELEKLKALLTTGGDGDGIKLSDATEGSDGTVDTKGLQDHQLSDAGPG